MSKTVTDFQIAELARGFDFAHKAAREAALIKFGRAVLALDSASVSITREFALAHHDAIMEADVRGPTPSPP